jgi:hypothetical protein
MSATMERRVRTHRTQAIKDIRKALVESDCWMTTLEVADECLLSGSYCLTTLKSMHNCDEVEMQKVSKGRGKRYEWRAMQ